MRRRELRTPTAGALFALWLATWLVTVLTWERDAAGYSIGMAQPAIVLHLIVPVVLGVVVGASAASASKSYGNTCALAGVAFGFLEFAVLAFVDALWLPQPETALPRSELLLGMLSGAVAYAALCAVLALLGGFLFASVRASMRKTRS